jgi:hypothetical protein
MQSVLICLVPHFYCYAECLSAVCRYSECRVVRITFIFNLLCQMFRREETQNTEKAAENELTIKALRHSTKRHSV